MKRFFRSLALVALIVTLGVALGAGTTATVKWTPPSQYVTNETLPSTDIAYYTITWTGDVSGTLKVTAPAAMSAVTVPCGNENFAVTVTTTATAVHPNVTSGQSNIVPYATGVVCSPNPPAGVSVS